MCLTMTKRDELKKSGADLIEQGVGLIARGMYRMGDGDLGGDPQAASDAGFSAVSVIRGDALEFMRKAKHASSTG